MLSRIGVRHIDDLFADVPAATRSPDLPPGKGELEVERTLAQMAARNMTAGSVPFFVGLAVVLPVLGHATWHLYRRVIEPDLSPRPQQLGPTRRQRRYAAQFPAALFGGENQP